MVDKAWHNFVLDPPYMTIADYKCAFIYLMGYKPNKEDMKLVK